MAFFDDLAVELGARRRRLRTALSDRGASFVEFLWLGGLSLAAMRGLVRADGWALGFLPAAAAVVGYFALEARRQAERDRGAEPEALKRRYDRLTLALLTGLALAGLGYFALAYVEPARAEIEAPAAIPEGALVIEVE